MHGLVAGYGVTYAVPTEHHRAGSAIDRAREERSAMQRYGAIAMNYVQFSAYYRSCYGAIRRSTDVERDNQIFTYLARRTGKIETGKKTPACRFAWATFDPRQRN